ncbi:MAG: hypothetical protein NUK62_01235 [Tenericutes bacterium]|nr:hypothetical protein [Mycoplasmatota bacterium]
MQKTNDRITTYMAQPWHKRWYSFNKQKIPMIFILIGVFFFTAFLDFEVQGTEFKLLSHIAAMQKFLNTPYNNLSAFYLFLLYLIALIQIFNTVSFAQKRSPFSLILITVLTTVQVAVTGLYTSIFFIEQANRLDYTIDSVARLAYSVTIIGSIFFIIGTVFAWFYVDWKYVKEKED